MKSFTNLGLPRGKNQILRLKKTKSDKSHIRDTLIKTLKNKGKSKNPLLFFSLYLWSSKSLFIFYWILFNE